MTCRLLVLAIQRLQTTFSVSTQDGVPQGSSGLDGRAFDLQCCNSCVIGSHTCVITLTTFRCIFWCRFLVSVANTRLKSGLKPSGGNIIAAISLASGIAVALFFTSDFIVSFCRSLCAHFCLRLAPYLRQTFSLPPSNRPTGLSICLSTCFLEVYLPVCLSLSVYLSFSYPMGDPSCICTCTVISRGDQPRRFPWIGPGDERTHHITP